MSIRDNNLEQLFHASAKRPILDLINRENKILRIQRGELLNNAMFWEYSAGTSSQSNEIGVAPTAKSNRFGKFLAANPTKPGYCQQLLLVFVHGILDNPESTWKLPNWMQTRAGVFADSFSFAYDAGVHHSCSIEDAARDLADCLVYHSHEREPNDKKLAYEEDSRLRGQLNVRATRVLPVQQDGGSVLEEKSLTKPEI